MGLIGERLYPYLLAVVLGGGCAAYYRFHGAFSIAKENDVRGLLSMINDVNAIILGFLMAIMAIIWAIQDKTAIRHQRQAGTYQYFIGYMKVAALGCMISILTNIIFAARLTMNGTANYHPYLFGAWLSLHAFCAAALHRVIKTFYAVLGAESS